jgi:hypothetical protein
MGEGYQFLWFGFPDWFMELRRSEPIGAGRTAVLEFIGQIWMRIFRLPIYWRDTGPGNLEKA